ncbi:MAG: hypothetical protein AAF438_20265 [Pseudomonadota bacterium]
MHDAASKPVDTVCGISGTWLPVSIKKFLSPMKRRLVETREGQHDNTLQQPGDV